MQRQWMLYPLQQHTIKKKLFALIRMDLFSDNIKVENLDKAIKLLKESRSGFFKLFDNSPLCMCMTTSTIGKRTYVRVNKKFLDTFGFDEDEIIGRTSIEIGILDVDESLRVGELIKTKGRLQNDYVKCKTKTAGVVHTVSSIELMEINNESYLVAFFVDITKIMEQQSIIEQHAKQLEAVNKELEAFSYSVSHDLRAPLRAINGYTQALEEDFATHFDEEGKQLLSGVLRNARKMGNLIDDLLQFARLGNLELQKTPIDMNALVQEVLSEFNTTIKHNAELRIAALHPLKGDYSMIRLAVVNLISNAIKYSSKKDIPVIEISSQQEADHVIFIIKDNGAGFDMRYAGKLFGVFQRLHRVAEFEGTGAGLAIVQRIIHKHGGTVTGEAELDKGATFRFSVPIAQETSPSRKD